MMGHPVGEAPAKGLRAWTLEGMKGHGINKVDIPPQTGGLIIFQAEERDIFGVQWDTGEITVHSVCEFAKKLVCIGTHQSLDEYLMDVEEEQ